MADEEVVTKTPKSRGVFVSTACGIGLCVFVLLLTFGVGVIVYFASLGANLCIFPWSPEQIERSRTEQLAKCQELRNDGTALCDLCNSTVSASTTVRAPTTTKSKTVRRKPRPKPANTTLSGVIAPLHYNLDLFMDIYQTNTSEFKLYGNVSILFIVKVATNNITFHARVFEIDNSTLTLASAAKTPAIVTSFADKARHCYVILLDEDLIVGEKYLLSLRYEKLMKKAAGGIYWSSYQDKHNKTRYIVSSHFQPKLARQSLPCFDEPRYKASFRTTIIRQSNYTAVFNTDVVRSVDIGDGYTKDTFKTTPLMSTYILAFAVLDYAYIETTTSSGVKYRTAARPDAIQYANMSHEFGSRVFEWLNYNLRPAYPLGKMDNLIVADQPGFAMENWGVVTYKERVLITENTTDEFKMKILRLFAHEHAHQWFGNLVTPLTWNVLWLSEGFVTYLEVIVLDALNPSWREEDYFVLNTVHLTLSTEEETRRPLVHDVASFGTLTYKKGSTVVRMLKNILGKRLFLKALNTYLKENAYGSVVLENLWAVINRECKKANLQLDIASVMEAWLFKTHYPLLTVTSSRAGDMEVSQGIYPSKWLTGNVPPGDERLRYKWTIPITYLTSNHSSWKHNQDEPLDVVWLNQNQDNALISDARLPDPLDSSSWVLVNINQVGYYRVNYNINNWLALIHQLVTDYTVIPPVNRAQIIDDAFALERAGQLKLPVALGTLRFLWHDDDYVPWEAAQKQFDILTDHLRQGHLFPAYSAYMKDLIAKHYRTFGMLTDNIRTVLETYQQTRFASLACSFGVKQCLEDAMTAFHNNTLKRASSELKLVVYCYAIMEGGMDEWNTVYQIYINTPDFRFSHMILRTLACVKEPSVVQRVLREELEKNKVRHYHRGMFFSTIMANKWTSYAMWNFLKENTAEFSRMNLTQYLLKKAANVFSGDVFLKEVESIQASSTKHKTDVMKNVMKTIADREQWMQAKGEDITTWLTDLGYGGYIY